MRCLRSRASSASRGGWIVLEYLREFGCLTAIVAVIVGLLQKLSPEVESAAAWRTGPSVYRLGLLDDGQQLWFNSHEGGLALLDVDSWTPVESLRFRNSQHVDADVSAASPALICLMSDQGRVRLIRGGHGHEVDLPLNDGVLSRVCVQTGGESAVGVTNAGVIVTWTWNGTGYDRQRDQLEGPLNLVELSPDGRWAAMLNGNETLVLWDRTARCEARRWWVHDQHCCSLAWSPDGRTLATGGKDGMVRVWERERGTLLWEAAGDLLAPCSLAFSSDGRRLVSGGFDKTVRVWNASSGKLEATLSAHRGPVRTLAFHPADDRLYSGSLDGEILEWSLATGSVLRRYH